MRLIGVDPGTKVVGWGIITSLGRRQASPASARNGRRGGGLKLVASGALSAPEKLPLEKRLAALSEGLLELCRTYAPDAAAVERAYFGKGKLSALRIGEARGAILAALGRAGVTVSEFSPSEIKRAVTGSGSGQKLQVRRMVEVLLGAGGLQGPEDVSDALAAAICLAHRLKLPRSAGKRRKRPASIRGRR